MQAVSGDLKDRTEAALGAGCDVVLHCNGEMEEMISVVAGAETMTDIAYRRWSMALDSLPAFETIDKGKALAQFDSLMSI